MDNKLISNLSLSKNWYHQEKIESIKEINELLNKFIKDPESLNELFIADLSKALSIILQHSIIIGREGDELASELILKIIKIFFRISEKNYKNRNDISKDFFAIIRIIFNEFYKHNFFVTDESDKDLVIKAEKTQKDLNYVEYNKLFQSEFEIKENPIIFKQKDLVDIYVRKYNPISLNKKKEWVKGKISSISYDKKEYTIKYYGQVENNHIDQEIFDFNSPKVIARDLKTKYLNKKLEFKKGEKVDICIEKEKENEKTNIWYQGVIIDIEENRAEDNEDLIYKNFAVEYKDIFFYDKDNNDNENDIYYETYEETEIINIAYDSFRIQKNHIFSDIQKKIIRMKNDGKKTLAKHYEDLLNFILDIFENDQNIEDFYKYELIEEKKKILL